MKQPMDHTTTEKRMRGPFRAASLLTPLSACLLGGALFAGGCAGDSSDPATAQAGGPAGADGALTAGYPDGTVFAIGGVPILGSDIDAYVPLIRLIDPHVVETSQRRRALTNVVLPIAAAQALDPAAREEAFLHAQSMLAAVKETGKLPADAPEANHLSGSWRDVGMVPFQVAMSTPIGSYSELMETPGAFTFFKFIATNSVDPSVLGATDLITIQRYDVPFLPDESSTELIQAGIDSLPIEVIDEEWESIIPPILLYPKSAPTR